jgi:hypothetical protein
MKLGDTVERKDKKIMYREKTGKLHKVETWGPRVMACIQEGTCFTWTELINLKKSNKQMEG